MDDDLQCLGSLWWRHRRASPTIRAQLAGLFSELYPQTLPVPFEVLRECVGLSLGGFHVVKPVRDNIVVQIVAAAGGEVSRRALRSMGLAVGLWQLHAVPLSRVLERLSRAGLLVCSSDTVGLGPVVAGVMPQPGRKVVVRSPASAATLVEAYAEQHRDVGIAAAAYATFSMSGESDSRRWRSRVGEALRRLAAGGLLVETSGRPITRYRRSSPQDARQSQADTTAGDSVALPDRYRLGDYVAINHRAVVNGEIDEQRVGSMSSRALLAFPAVLFRPNGLPVLNPVTGQPFLFESLRELRDEIAAMQELLKEDS